MKKLKKMLLAFVPLTTIAITTPIVLTACSDTTTNTTTPGGDNGNTNPDGGNNGGNGGSNGGGSTETVKPSFSPDNTNNSSFKLGTSSEAQKILDNYKKAEGKEAADKVLDDSLKGFPKKDSGNLVQDVLNMWSNNNWFAITKTAKDENVKKTFISKLTINEAKVDASSGKASFNVEYKNAFTDNKNRVIEATQVLKASEIVVDANTPSIEITKEVPKSYKIDGKEQPLSGTTLLETNDEIAKNNFENVLKQNKVTIDAKQIFTSFITNHNITHAEKPPVVDAKAPIWNKTEVDKDTSLKYSNENTIVMQLKSTGDPKWGNCLTTTPYANIVSTMKNTIYVNKIKSLITLNDYESPVLEYGSEIKNENNSDMDITIKFTKKASVSKEDTNPILTLKIKGFKIWEFQLLF